METRKKFTPEPGKIYTNKGGGTYLCVRSFTPETPTFVNTLSGWTLRAHGVGIYDDGTIDWDYSTDGYFA